LRRTSGRVEFDPPERETELELLAELPVEVLVVEVGGGVVAIEAVVVALAEETVLCAEIGSGVNVRRM
jgi:hypothetical protein